MHRRCILASFRSNSLCAGQTFFTQGPYLRIAEEITIDLDQAVEWEPPGVLLGQGQPLFVVNVCVQRLLKAVVKLGNAKGLGQTILPISAAVDGNERATFIQGRLIAKVRSSIHGLMRACLKEDMVQIIQIGRELVGLGPGLTPSGDDFLGGLLFAAHSLRNAYPEDFAWEQEPVMDLIDWARTQTHPISHVVLCDLALGHGPEPLHEVVTSLLNGQNLDRTMAGVTRLIEIGDTSGWDILAGMVTGMFLIGGKLKGPRGSQIDPYRAEENFDSYGRHQTED